MKGITTISLTYKINKKTKLRKRIRITFNLIKFVFSKKNMTIKLITKIVNKVECAKSCVIDNVPLFIGKESK